LVSRAFKIPIGKGYCLQYPKIIETILHIFQNCTCSHSNWKQVWPLLCGEHPPLVFTPNYFHLVRDNLHATPIASTRLFLLHQIRWSFWLNRDAFTFCNEQKTFILALTLEETSTLLSAAGLTLPLGALQYQIEAGEGHH
jgi:hypothetical protein